MHVVDIHVTHVHRVERSAVRLTHTHLIIVVVALIIIIIIIIIIVDEHRLTKLAARFR